MDARDAPCQADAHLLVLTACTQSWAGLRGAVGLAMSLLILLDPLVPNESFKAHCVFYMGWMALLTVWDGPCM